MKRTTKRRVEQIEKRAGVTDDRVTGIDVYIHDAGGQLVKVEEIRFGEQVSR